MKLPCVCWAVVLNGKLLTIKQTPQEARNYAAKWPWFSLTPIKCRLVPVRKAKKRRKP